jgi:hypothetical protein
MTRKRSLKVAERDTKVEQAIATLSRGEFANVNQAAKHFKLHFTTLKRRLDGRKSIAESREPSQVLKIPEEHAVVRWIQRTDSSVCRIRANRRQMDSKIFGTPSTLGNSNRSWD